MTGIVESVDEVADGLTRYLVEHCEGQDESLGKVVTHLYPELRRLAGMHVNMGAPNTLSATDILHDAFEKLSKYKGNYNNRAHFLAIASQAMRQIIIDYARRKTARKRGGNLKRVEFDEAQIAVAAQAEELLMINQLLENLEAKSPKTARVFECRFFGGMTDPETSEALGIPLRTVQREWMKAKVFLSGDWGADAK